MYLNAKWLWGHFIWEWNCVRSYFTHNHFSHTYIFIVCFCANVKWVFFSFLSWSMCVCVFIRAFFFSGLSGVCVCACKFGIAISMKFTQIWKSFDIALDQKNMWNVLCVCVWVYNVYNMYFAYMKRGRNSIYIHAANGIDERKATNNKQTQNRTEQTHPQHNRIAFISTSTMHILLELYKTNQIMLTMGTKNLMKNDDDADDDENDNERFMNFIHTNIYGCVCVCCVYMLYVYMLYMVRIYYIATLRYSFHFMIVIGALLCLCVCMCVRC